MNKAEKYKKSLLKLENNIVRENKLFCINNDIVWTKNHDVCLRKAMREFFEAGLIPIMRDVIGIDKIETK